MNVLKRTFKDLNLEWTYPLKAIPVSAWATALLKRSWGPERWQAKKESTGVPWVSVYQHPLSPKTRKMRINWCEFETGSPGWSGHWSTCPVRRGWQSSVCSSWRRDDFRGLNSNLPIPTTKLLRKKSQAL